MSEAETEIAEAPLPEEETIQRNEAAAAVKLPELIALDRLCLSGLNVRQTERDAAIESLAEDIAANGLKQNLVVVPAHFSTGEADADWADKFEVIAGGRRFQALSLLVADGRLPGDTPVPCLVEERDGARTTSLSENYHRVAMNPADEFVAFHAIVIDLEDGRLMDREAAIRLCARRQGVTVNHVKQRLRLADLAPEILQALREGVITADQAKAYASVSDHKLQLAVFKAQLKSNWQPHNAQTVRNELRGKTLPVTDARMIFVGLENYLADGGRTENEMFMGQRGEERALDVALLLKLAAEKAEPMLPALAKADGFKSGAFAEGVGYISKYPKAPADFVKTGYEYTPPTKAKLKKSIAIYVVDSEGTGLTRAGRFRPKEEAEETRSQGYTPPTPEEIAAQEREREINVIAHRLAVGPFKDTPLEGRFLWPNFMSRRVEESSDLLRGEEDSAFVTVLIKVSRADVQAQMEAAAIQYDAQLAEEEAARAAEAAASEQPDVDAEDEEEAAQ